MCRLKSTQLFASIVVMLIYTPYYYVYNERYVRMTLLEYYYICIIVAVIFILDVLYILLSLLNQIN